MAARLAARKQGKRGEEQEDDDASSSDDETANEQRKKGSICNVNITNFDLSHIVNGFPNDPIELRPFDNCFTKDKIIQNWIAVGFLPMTGNAANDPKVAYELGPGGAPDDAQARIESLVEDYGERSNELTGLGFNGDIFDLAPRRVQEIDLPANEEAAINLLIKNKGMNKAGSLYKAGVIMANSRVVLEAARRSALLTEKEKENAAQKREDKERQSLSDAVSAFRNWVNQGGKTLEDGSPVLQRKDAVAIVRVLLPRIDVKGERKIKEFSTAKACMKWLGEIGRGTTWDEEMRGIED